MLTIICWLSIYMAQKVVITCSSCHTLLSLPRSLPLSDWSPLHWPCSLVSLVSSLLEVGPAPPDWHLSPIRGSISFQQIPQKESHWLWLGHGPISQPVLVTSEMRCFNWPGLVTCPGKSGGVSSHLNLRLGGEEAALLEEWGRDIEHMERQISIKGTSWYPGCYCLLKFHYKIAKHLSF